MIRPLVAVVLTLAAWGAQATVQFVSEVAAGQTASATSETILPPAADEAQSLESLLASLRDEQEVAEAPNSTWAVAGSKAKATERRAREAQVRNAERAAQQHERAAQKAEKLAQREIEKSQRNVEALTRELERKAQATEREIARMESELERYGAEKSRCEEKNCKSSDGKYEQELAQYDEVIAQAEEQIEAYEENLAAQVESYEFEIEGIEEMLESLGGDLETQMTLAAEEFEREIAQLELAFATDWEDGWENDSEDEFEFEEVEADSFEPASEEMIHSLMERVERLEAELQAAQSKPGSSAPKIFAPRSSHDGSNSGQGGCCCCCCCCSSKAKSKSGGVSFYSTGAAPIAPTPAQTTLETYSGFGPGAGTTLIRVPQGDSAPRVLQATPAIPAIPAIPAMPAMPAMPASPAPTYTPGVTFAPLPARLAPQAFTTGVGYRIAPAMAGAPTSDEVRELIAEMVSEVKELRRVVRELRAER